MDNFFDQLFVSGEGRYETNDASDKTNDAIKHTLRLVAYDISDAKRLRLVARTCSDYGVRIERSVFECDLSDKDFVKFWERLLSIIDQQRDALIVYKICRSCVRSIQTAGHVYRKEASISYVF